MLSLPPVGMMRPLLLLYLLRLRRFANEDVLLNLKISLDSPSALDWKPPLPKETMISIVADDDFWKGEWQSLSWNMHVFEC